MLEIAHRLPHRVEWDYNTVAFWRTYEWTSAIGSAIFLQAFLVDRFFFKPGILSSRVPGWFSSFAGSQSSGIVPSRSRRPALHPSSYFFHYFFRSLESMAKGPKSTKKIAVRIMGIT